MTLKKVTSIFKSSKNVFYICLFYGCLLACIADRLFFYFNQSTLDRTIFLFVFLATFNYYYYQKKIAFSFHYPLHSKLKIIDLLIFLIAGFICFVCFLQFNQTCQNILLLTTLICFLYHNHSRYFFFRKIPFLKNVIISLSWISIGFIAFNLNHLASFSFIVIAGDFFILILCQSLLFDFMDKTKDQQFGHQTFSAQISPGSLFKIIQIMACVGILLDILLKQQGHISVLSLIIQMMIYSAYFIPAFQKATSYHKMPIYVTDILILLKAISLNL